MDPDLLAAAKALTGAARLRILGQLATASATQGQLGASTGLSTRLLSRELRALVSLGLVTESQSPEGVEYRLDLQRLGAVGRALNALEPADVPIEGLPVLDGGGRWSSEDRRVLAAFIDNGRLTSIPAQLAKRLVILRYLAETAFEPGAAYAERDVNMRLALRHPDVAALRRYLVDERFMARDHGVYRLRDRGEWPPTA